MDYETIDSVRDSMAQTLDELKYRRHRAREEWINSRLDMTRAKARTAINRINQEIEFIKSHDYEEYFYKYLWDCEDAQDLYRTLK